MPKRLRQYYLGSSPQRTLCLISGPSHLPPVALGKCYISKLPDELLAEVFAYLSPETDYFDKPTYEQCPPIPLICKHWERVYDATLYREISFVERSGWQRRRTSNLVKALQQQPELSKHVRKISVQLQHPSEAICRVIADTINSCRAIRDVSLRLDWSSNVWPIVQAVGKLPRLEKLQLFGEYDWGPSSQMIVEYFAQPTLRHLRLYGYGLGSRDEPRAPCLPTQISSQDEIDKLSDLAHSHTSALMSLALQGPSALPHCTKILLNWPSRLVELSLSLLTHSAYKQHYTLDAVGSILDIHRESLQRITVGIISKKESNANSWTMSGIPDFSKFHGLQELRLSAYNVLAEKPSDAATKLAAPLLRHLDMNYYKEYKDQDMEFQDGFAEEQVRWMADFATHTSAAKRGNKLESIVIDFDPDQYQCISLYERKEIWPWEYLEQAEQEMTRCNIAMTHSEPIYTRDAWYQMVACYGRSEEEARAVAW